MKKQLQPVAFTQVRLNDGLLMQRQALNARVTVPLIFEKCSQTGRIAALACRWDGTQEYRPHPFWDSDIGKMIECAAYSLQTHPNPALEGKINQVIDQLAQAQESGGYLNTYYQSCERREDRWSNLYYMHELYCAGHLIEGAVAYAKATGKTKLLEVMCRYADLICETFGEQPHQNHGYCGHPEIELALVRLYELTKQKKYLDLSKHFIDKRGTKPYFFEEESLRRGVDTTKTANQKRHLKDYLASRGPYAEYQAHKPVREQDEPVGHAVRAMYLYSGMADIADYFDDEALYAACCKLWAAMSTTQYAITGGIGPSSDGERFTFAYDLPNEYTYNETCASVALVLWAGRMLQFEADGKYADIMEQTLFNTVLGSVSCDGSKFFYANYLEVRPERFEHASKALIDKMRAERQEWFDVSCCPPNVSRLLGSIGGYVASTNQQGFYLHLYASAQLQGQIAGQTVVLNVQTDYPWDGLVRIDVQCAHAQCFDLNLRIPAWCGTWSVQVNKETLDAEQQRGYCKVSRSWESGDCVLLQLELKPVLMEANPCVREDCGKLAIQRGPVVYCLEQIDNGENLQDISIALDPNFAEKRGEITADRSAVMLELDAVRRGSLGWNAQALYQKACSAEYPIRVKAVPYYLWGNRGFGEMLVWVNRK